jgi:excinuclease ABC subunit A
MMEKPDVDSIEGLSPAISIEQKTAGRNPRSTVGTVTEVYDYLRLLWARVGVPHCPDCGKPVERQSASQIVERVMTLPAGTWVEVLAPVVRGRKGEFRELFEEMRKKGFSRARIDGAEHRLEEIPPLNRRANHDISIFVERRVDVSEENRSRIADAVEQGLRNAEGVVEVIAHGEAGEPQRELYSEA